MIISVASGKGGTGKTTVSTSLAFSLNDDVQFLDCDV
ncbi:MAG: P-loop NTPase, partial [Candidatus Omnitrophota bacterium]